MSVVQVAAVVRTRRRSRLSHLGVVGWLALAVIVLFIFVAVFGEALAPHDPNAIDIAFSNVGPIPGHPLGFDELGRDLFSRLLVGARSSFVGPLALVAVSTVLGTALALLAAWRRGWTDATLSAGFDIAFAFPGLLLAIMLATMFGSSLPVAVVALALAYTPGLGRLLRSTALRETGMEYVKAFRVMGYSDFRIVVRHVLPNLMPFIIAQAIVMFGYATLDLGGLSFLGLGVQPPTADWGVMVAAGAPGLLQGYPMQTLAAGTCLVLAAVSFGVLGDRLARMWGVE
jgi:peptide/nickel transport system permease protein